MKIQNVTKSARDEVQDLREQLEIERADRVELEKHMDLMIEYAIQEKMRKMEAGFNAALERIAKMTQPPIELKDE